MQPLFNQLCNMCTTEANTAKMDMWPPHTHTLLVAFQSPVESTSGRGNKVKTINRIPLKDFDIWTQLPACWNFCSLVVKKQHKVPIKKQINLLGCNSVLEREKA